VSSFPHPDHTKLIWLSFWSLLQWKLSWHQW